MSVATAIRQSAMIDAHGKLELTMPATWAGTQVEVIVLAEPQPDVEADLSWQLYPLADGLTALMVRDGAWHIAYCPEVPGANGQGETPDACLASLQSAIDLIREDQAESDS